MGETRWRRAGAVVLALQAAYNGFLAVAPLSLLFMPADASADRGAVLGEVVPMLAVALLSAVFAVLTWRSGSRSLLTAVVVLAGIQSLLGVGWVGIGFIWGGPLLAAIYALLPVPGAALFAWIALVCFLSARRRRPGDQSSAVAGEGTGGV